jgi:hypothetical protein
MREGEPAPRSSEDQWHDEWIIPIVRAIYQRDGAAAQRALQAAQRAPRPAELPSDFRRVIDYRLPYLAFRIYID